MVPAVLLTIFKADVDLKKKRLLKELVVIFFLVENCWILSFGTFVELIASSEYCEALV